MRQSFCCEKTAIRLFILMTDKLCGPSVREHFHMSFLVAAGEGWRNMEQIALDPEA